MLGKGRHDVQREAVRFRHVSRHGIDLGFHQVCHERDVARQAVELGDDKDGFSAPAQIERGGELRPIVLPTAFNLGELGDQLAPGGDVLRDGPALCCASRPRSLKPWRVVETR